MADFLREYIGDTSQLFAVKEYTLRGGRAEGVKAVDISNGAGVDMTILPDRGMDIYHLKYKGQSLNYLAKTGIAAPAYYDSQGSKFMDSFYAGFLTTCGLDNIGPACEADGKAYGMHGGISNTPAEHVNIIHEEKDGVPSVKISGTMRKAPLFSDNLVMTRTYQITYGSKEVIFWDEIENIGFQDAPVMILYHFNMGYPLLSEHAELILPTKEVRPRTEHAAKFADSYAEITPPAADYPERCYYHDIIADEQGNATVGIYNSQEQLGLKLTYDKKLLDHFIQWKLMDKGQYVMGLEPCNATIEGRADAIENQSIKTLKPGEKITYKMQLTMFD